MNERTLKSSFLNSLDWKSAWNRTAIVFAAGLFLKLILFDAIWCIDTTFASFSYLETYLSKLFIATLLLLPYILFKSKGVESVILFCLDSLLICNLLYFRTYYTHIPLSSYGLAGNLADFTASVRDSFRMIDILLPLSSVVTIFIALRRPDRKGISLVRRFPGYFAVLVGTAALNAVCLGVKGGFHQAFNAVRQSSYLCSSSAPMFTVFGCMYYDLTEQQQKITPEIDQRIGSWLAAQPAWTPLPDSIETRRNCILILAESFESWVLEQEVEGQEITPCLNRLLKEPTTLYAPHVLTQVKGGRSIDAQLMINAGMLPLNSGAYSSLYPDNHYATLPKAMHELKHSRNYLLTIDKVSTWNQGAIAYSFGLDTIIAYHDFRKAEAFGTHKRIGDVPFFEQCSEKISDGEVWKQDETVFMQFVTYSGHAPFVLPQHLQEISFSDSIPAKAADYMKTARYTDKALGQFVDFLKSRPEYKETLIVITGDHEGLAFYRNELCQAPATQGIVSDKPYTPLIILNSPVGMRYEDVMGQIDIYPTLLQLLGLERYPWKGMGQSILSPTKRGLAVGSHMNVEGDASDSLTLHHLQQAHDIADLMLRFDYLKEKSGTDGNKQNRP
jgi:phosphoglycerol transferase MdoB-like AlkP superfamily enzyme